MSWSWDEISRIWLRDMLDPSPQPTWWVEAFDACERYLGRKWIEQSRFHQGTETWGVGPAAYLASQGRRLAVLDGIKGSKALIERLRRRNPSAWAELTAIWLLRHNDDQVAVEIEPTVADWPKTPDFRAHRGDEMWTYVEVTQPNVSAEQARLRKIMDRLCELLMTVDGSYALEVLLNRAPSPAELDELMGRIPDVCRLSGQHDVPLLADLGSLFLNDTQPGLIQLRDRDTVYRPRLGLARSMVQDGSHRHIAVRLAYTDERADAMLRAEARQLPKTHPGLIMIQTSGATGGFRQWKPVLAARLHPKQHTRVGGVVLFESGMLPNNDGLEEWRPETSVILNAYALKPLPDWVIENLRRHEVAVTGL